MSDVVENGVHGIPLFDPTILTNLDFDESGVKMKYGISPHYAGDSLELRPLQNDDYSRGFVHLLSQLTKVGDLTEQLFQERFNAMQNCKDSYYILVIEDKSVGRLVASGTLAIEQKYIHCAATRGRVEDVVVDSDYRGRHLGQLLLETLTLLSEHVGCYKTSLECKDHLVEYYSLFDYKKEQGLNYLCKRFYH